VTASPTSSRDDVAAWLCAIAARDPAAPAFRVRGAPSLSWRGLAERIAATAAALAGLGLARGDVVVGVTADRADMLAALALLPAGCTLAPLGPRLGEEAYAGLLRRLDAKAALLPADREHPFARAVRAASVTELGFVRSGDATGMFDVVALRRTASLERARRWPAHWCYVLATSGTTGAAKLVPQTHAQIIDSAVELARWLDLGPRDASGHVSPGFLANGVRPSFHLALAAGAPVVVLPENGVDALVEAMEAGEVGYSAASFTFCRELLARAAGGRRVRPRGLRFIRVSAGKLRDDEILALEDLLGVPAITGLGSTETTIFLHQRLPPHTRVTGSLGRPVAAEVRLVDDAGREVEAGAPGEIQVRATRVLEGYLDDPAATAAAFVDGWYRTGDLGHVGAHGEIVHLGRSKEIINRGGEKFSPVEIDEALRSLPGVADAASFAFAHPTLGEEIAAAIVAGGDAPAREADLLERARAILGPRRAPKRLHFIDALPRNAAGKLLRASLAATFSASASYATGTPGTGESPLVAAICALWADALGRDVVAPSSTFASLGGQAEQARALIGSVRSVFDVAFDEAALDREAATPAAMANAVTRGRR